MSSNKLTDKECKNLKLIEGEKYKCISDGGGMYLEILPNGGRYWRMKYRYAGKQTRMALGVYPDVTLAEAREKREEARSILKNGQDPAVTQ